MNERQRLLELLTQLAYEKRRVTLSSGKQSDFYIDTKQASLSAEGHFLVGRLVLQQIREAYPAAQAVGGMTMGADPVACAALAGGADVKAFFVRKEAKAHGLQRRIEGPVLAPQDRCVVVEDVVTTGSSALAAIAALRQEGHEICGVIGVLDRLAGARPALERAAGAPYVALSTIDEVYPERPDRHAA